MATDPPGAAQPAKVAAARLLRTDSPPPAEPPAGARSWEAAVDWYFANLDLQKQLHREQAARQTRPPAAAALVPEPPQERPPGCYTTATLVPVQPAPGPTGAGRMVTNHTIYLGPPPAAGTIEARDAGNEPHGSAPRQTPAEQPPERPTPAAPPAAAARRVSLAPTADLRATEGQPFTAVVASLTDTTARDGSAYSAAIDWGDGSSADGTVTANERGGFDVVGSQTYAEAGSYTVTVTVRGPGGASAEAVTTATVADAPLTAAGSRLDVPAGEAFTRVVCTFTDTNPYGLADEFAAVIDWGDGTIGSGAVTGRGRGRFDVTGSHAYPQGGVYAVTVTVESRGGAAATARGQASVRSDLTFVRGPLPVTAAAGVRTGKQVLAAFTDVAPAGRPSAYTALIDWGDGSTTMGFVTARPGEFEVAGSHAYARAGAYTVGITVERRGAPPVTGVTTATVEG